MESIHKNSIGYWCHRIALAHRAHIESMTREMGFSAPEAFLLMYLFRKGQSSLVELATLMEQAHPSVLRHIYHLESMGMIKRSPHKNDRRIKVVELTDEGAVIIPKIRSLLKEVQKKATEGIKQADIEKFFDIAKQVDENLCNETPCID